jgi:hypothetical protein
MEVVVGVDSHKATFAAAVVDLIGRPIEVGQCSNDRRGFAEFLGGSSSIAQIRDLRQVALTTQGSAT